MAKSNRIIKAFKNNKGVRVSSDDVFRNPLSKKNKTYNEATGKGRIETRRPLDDYGIYGRPHSLNKKDRI